MPQEGTPQYQAVAQAALKYMDRAWAQGINENQEYLTVCRFLQEIANGQQEVREIKEQDDG